MMTCRDLYAFLDDFLDGSLADATRQTFEAHLACCAACRRYLQSYQRTVEVARAAERDDDGTKPPEELIHAVLATRAAALEGDRE